MSQAHRREIAVVCGDPGGTKAVTPVLQTLLQDQALGIHPFAYREARKVWHDHNIAFNELSETHAVQDSINLLLNCKADLLVTGTSINALELEKVFIAAAGSLGVPSLSILDFWSNYARRFSKRDRDLKYLPSVIAVIDRLAFEEMVSEGLPAKRLVITGQPAFDALASKRKAFKSADKNAVRKSLGVGQEDHLVVFVSQPFSQLFGDNDSNPEYPGYDEHFVLKNLQRALERIVVQAGHSISLVVNPHLREDVKWFYDIRSNLISIVVAEEADFPHLAMSADLVTGMTSTKLVEAAILGCVAISLQIGAKESRKFNMARLGIAKNVYKKEALVPEIASILLNKKIRRLGSSENSPVEIDSGATDRVVNLIYQMIDNNPTDWNLADITITEGGTHVGWVRR